MARGRIVEDEGAAGGSSGTDARGPDGDDGFVVVDDDFVEPGHDDELNQPSLGGEDTAAVQEPSPFSPAAFPALGACLSGRVPASPTAAEQQQQRSRANPSSSSERTDDTPPPFDAAAAAVIAAVDLVHKFLYAYAAMGYRFLQSHGAVAFDFLYAHALVVFEFLYAYAVVAVQETLAIVEKVWSRARPAWRRWRGRGPAPVKRVLKHRLFPVAVAVALSMLLVLPAYWAVPRVGGAGGDGPGRVSTRQWQAKYDLLNSKYSADIVRQRLKYDNLAGRHLELQSEYESLLKDYKNQQRAARANRNAPKAPPETCDRAESVLGLKEALKTAEQSAYDYFTHFSEGLRQDVHEIAERCLGKTGEEGGRGGGGGGGKGDSARNSDRDKTDTPIHDAERRNSDDRGDRDGKRDAANIPIDDGRKNSDDGGGGGGGGETTDAPADPGALAGHGGATTPAPLEQTKIEDGVQSRQQLSETEKVAEIAEVEAEQRRVRVARRGMRHVGWTLKIEELAGVKETGLATEGKYDRRREQQARDASQAAKDRAARHACLTAQAAREPSGERTDGETFDVSCSGKTEEEVGNKDVDELPDASHDVKRDSTESIKESSADVNVLELVVILDEAASDSAKIDQGVITASGSEAIDGVEVSDGKQVGGDGTSTGGFQWSGSGNSLGKNKEDGIASVYSARAKEARARRKANEAILHRLVDGDSTNVPKDRGGKSAIPDGAKPEVIKVVEEQPQTIKSSTAKPEDVRHAALRLLGEEDISRERSEEIARSKEALASEAKAVKPETAKFEDALLLDEQPQTSASYAVTLVNDELTGVSPPDPEKGRMSKPEKVEEVDSKGCSVGGKRKCSKSKHSSPRYGDKGQKGEKRKDYWLKDEEARSKKKKKKAKDGKGKGKNKQ